jgi:hypothetical protein
MVRGRNTKAGGYRFMKLKSSKLASSMISIGSTGPYRHALYGLCPIILGSFPKRVGKLSKNM